MFLCLVVASVQCTSTTKGFRSILVIIYTVRPPTPGSTHSRSVACGIQCAQEHHNRGVSRISARGVPHTKSGGRGGGGGGGQFASGPIYEKWWGGGGGSSLQIRYTKSGGAIRFRSDTKSGGAVHFRSDIRKVGGEGGGGSPLQVRYTKSGGGGGAIRFRYDTKSGGGGGNSLLVSYPDPYVRNDDHRLQYDITYRGSGNKVVRNGSSATECSGMAEAIQHWSGLGVAIKFFYIDSCHTS